jgi:hypothetical protein
MPTTAATVRKGAIHRATAPTAENVTPGNLVLQDVGRHPPTAGDGATPLRYGMHADRNTSGVHTCQADELMQKPSFSCATMRGPLRPLSYTVAASQRMTRFGGAYGSTDAYRYIGQASR